MLSVLGRTIVPSFLFFALYYRETFAMRRRTETERNENETSQDSLLTLPNLLAFAHSTIFSRVLHGCTCIYISVEVATMDAWAAWTSPLTRRLQSLLRIAPTSLPRPYDLQEHYEISLIATICTEYIICEQSAPCYKLQCARVFGRHTNTTFEYQPLSSLICTSRRSELDGQWLQEETTSSNSNHRHGALRAN
jgi:hypothetical protein